MDRIQKALFEGTCRLTARFPRGGSLFLDTVFRSIAGHPLLSALLTRHNQRVVRSVASFRRFLVIPDIHIGDAVMSQSALTAVRDFFPEARVDYVVNKTAYPLIEGNPEATRVLPFFVNGSFPAAQELRALRQMIQAERYDLVLNVCPYIKSREIALAESKVLSVLSYAPTIVQNERRPSAINHFAYGTYRFTRDLLSLVARPVRADRFKGLRLTLSDQAMEHAWRFFSQTNLPSRGPVVMFNPDAASPYTLMPFGQQAAFLNRLTELRVPILLGEGHTMAGIGERLRASLPARFGSQVKMIPASLSLEAYAALIDLCDVFISPDTGPLHLAAARKFSRSGRYEFSNRTAVQSYFGATPPRMSGYDSTQSGYLPANQDAPSWCHTGRESLPQHHLPQQDI